MNITKAKFDLFIEWSERLPNVFNLRIHEKIKQFFAGNMPVLSLQEQEAIKNYLPHAEWSKFNKLTNQVTDEITWNLTTITLQDQRKAYLDYLIKKLDPIVLSLENTPWIEEVEKLEPHFAERFFTRLTAEQLPAFKLIKSFLWRDNRYYYIMYTTVRDYVLKQPKTVLSDEILLAPKKQSGVPKYTQKVRGLSHYYLSKTEEGSAINSYNMNNLAKKYGFYSVNSGNALADEFGYFKNENNRLKLTGKKRVDNTMDKTFKCVIEVFSDGKFPKSLKMANDEYQLFQEEYQRFYN